MLNIASMIPVLVEVCASIIRDSRTKKIFEEIGSLLKDSNPDVQDHALKAVFAVSQNRMF